MVAVLFVCMGNICRSPMAEGAFQAAVMDAGLQDRIRADSAGTIGYHAGSPPDPRAQAAARKKGVDITAQKSRKVTQTDFTRFDYIMAMDRENYQDLMNQCPDGEAHRIHMFLAFAPGVPMDEMPDPYYGHSDQFSVCFDAAEQAASGLLDHVRKEHF